jgi:hypothetical protein
VSESATEQSATEQRKLVPLGIGQVDRTPLTVRSGVTLCILLDLGPLCGYLVLVSICLETLVRIANIQLLERVCADSDRPVAWVI